MRLILTVSALALTAAAVSPAAAQQASAQGQAAAQAAPAFCPDTLSKKARETLAVYNEAVNAGDTAKATASRAAATAAVKTDAERCVLGQIDLNAAVKANDNAAVATQAEALASNPAANKTMVAPMLLDAAKMRYNAKDYANASKLLDRVTALTPNNGEAYILLADSHVKAGQAGDAPALALKGINLEKAAGRKPQENWYKRALTISLDAKSPTAIDIAREWAGAYPSPASWRDATVVLTRQPDLRDEDLIDVYRLQLATKAFTNVQDVGLYANLASKLGYPAEAEAALKAGIASGVAPASNASVAEMLKMAQSKIPEDKRTLAAATAKALAGGNAKTALAYGDANYGYGNYAKAAEMYRAVLGMNAADVPTANLRLGMSLAMSGDKAGAKEVLAKVTGPKAAIAKFWLTYIDSQA